MSKWFVKLAFGPCGCVGYTTVEAATYDEAYELAYAETVDWAESYGYYQDIDVFGDLDTVGCDWDEDEQEYAQTGFIDPLVEPYNKEKHEGYLA